jgi:hypothetical protein|tara:strand:- start:747 stop:1001 length:255 start_codon:yes stop_codon:yes gene_type:complete
MLKADGLDDAIIGVGHRCGEPTVVVYDIDLSIQAVQRELKCEIWEAVEYFNFNILGSYIGEHTPIFVERIQGIKELEEWVESNG